MMLRRYQYKKQYKQLLHKMEEPGRILNHDSLGAFSFFSANLYNFLPLMPYAQHGELFKRYRFNQWLNGLDARYFNGRYPLAIHGRQQLEDRLSKGQGIICTFHFGAYQLINYLLVKARIPYALLVAGQVVDSWKERYPQLMAELEEAERQGRFRIINANQAAALREMLALIQSGYYLLVYVDGMEGIEERDAEQLVQMPLLGQQVRLPKGAAYLAHRFQLPVYPVIALRNGFQIELPAFDAFLPEKDTGMQVAVSNLLQKLFACLVPYLMHWPEQWENWSQLHRLLVTDQYLHGERWLAAKYQLDGRRDDFGLYTIKEQHFLLQKKGYQSYRLHKKEYEILLKRWYGEMLH